MVTSYEGMKSLKALLLPCNWDYCVLDEGQRIRNPDAEVPLISRPLHFSCVSPHRILKTVGYLHLRVRVGADLVSVCASLCSGDTHLQADQNGTPSGPDRNPDPEQPSRAVEPFRLRLSRQTRYSSSF